jgi:hypothetical protein
MPSLPAPENTLIQHRQQLAVVNRVLWGLASISEAYTEPVRCATVPSASFFSALFFVDPVTGRPAIASPALAQGKFSP